MKNPRACASGLWKSKNYSAFAVIADGLNRAAFHGFLATRFSSGDAGCLLNVGITAVIAAGEVVGRGFAAQVAINALIINVKLADNVIGYLFAISAIK